MNKMLIALAAASFALALTPAAQAGFTVPSISGKSLVQKTCDGEDAAEYLEERAEARAEAMEEGEGYPAAPGEPAAAAVASFRRARAACRRNAQEDGRCFRQDGYQGGYEVGHEDGNEVGDQEGGRMDQEVGVKERRFRRCGKLQEILLLGRHDPVGPLRVRDRRVSGRRAGGLASSAAPRPGAPGVPGSSAGMS